jgi:hypothetical protein
VDGRPDAMPSRPVECLRRGGEIAARDALEGKTAERGGDRVTLRAHDEHVAVACLARVRRRSREHRRRPLRDRRIAREDRARGVEHRSAAQVDRERPKPRERARRRERGGAHATGRAAAVGRARDNGGVTFTRIAWLVTVLACVVTGVALLLSGYVGYAAVFGAVGACAAINLR